MGQIHEQPGNVPGCNHEKVLVPKKGLEPPHPCGYMDLNHARLPIPPLRRGKRTMKRMNSLRWQESYCTSATVSSPSATRAQLAAESISPWLLTPCCPYSFNLLCSVLRLIPRISAARVLLLCVASRVLRISKRSPSPTVVPTPR